MPDSIEDFRKRHGIRHPECSWCVTEPGGAKIRAWEAESDTPTDLAALVKAAKDESKGWYEQNKSIIALASRAPKLAEAVLEAREALEKVQRWHRRPFGYGEHGWTAMIIAVDKALAKLQEVGDD